MIQVTPYLFGIALDVRVERPRPFSQQKVEQILNRLVDTEHGLALKGEQIRLRNFDSAYDYDLKASLLGANGIFVYDAEKSYLAVSGGRTLADAKLLGETAKRFLWTSEVAEDDVGVLSVNTHARADSTDAREGFLRGFGSDERIVGPGALGYVKVTNWEHQVKFSVEPSLGAADSLFLVWNSEFRGRQWLTTVDQLTLMLESVAAVFAVQFKALAEV